MNKKAIAILGAIFILIVGTLGFLIYSKYGNNSTQKPPPLSNGNNQDSGNTTPPPEGNGNNVNPTPSTTSTPTPTPTESENQSKFIKLTNDQVVSPVLFFNGLGVTYFDKQGKLWQADLETDSAGKIVLERKRQLEIPTKPNFSRVIWPDLGENFYLEFKFLGEKTWSFYNNALGSYTDLPKQVVSFDWISGGEKIVYVWLEGDKATLNSSSPDTKDWQLISEMWEKDNQIDISPDGLNILYYRLGNQESTNAINLTTPDGKLWRGLVKDGYNFGVSWSPDSRKFLFAKKDKTTQKYQLWVYDLYTSETKNLGLFTTVEKTVWDKDGENIFAAVPEIATEAEGALTEDIFYKINVETLVKQSFKSEGLRLDGREMFLSKDGSKLFFKNAQDGGLYYLNLK